MLISDSEDHEAHGVCVELLTGLRKDAGPDFTDGFFDMACLQGARKKISEDDVCLHRCLQHTKVFDD